MCWSIGSMWGERTVIAAVMVSLVLQVVPGEGHDAKVLCQPGQKVTLPCSHESGHHPAVAEAELSVQWRGPHHQLLCHYIKHKDFQNCSSGYSIADTDRVVLTILSVKLEDFGLHICSLSKIHEFSDFHIEVVMFVPTSATPRSRGSCSGGNWGLTFQMLTFLTSLWKNSI